jgi:hypothetical protein
MLPQLLPSPKKSVILCPQSNFVWQVYIEEYQHLLHHIGILKNIFHVYWEGFFCYKLGQG